MPCFSLKQSGHTHSLLPVRPRSRACTRRTLEAGSWSRQARSVGAAAASRTDILRSLLQEPGCHAGPCCHDALSARLIEAAGFRLAFLSGFSTAAAAAALPDVGLLSYGEVVAVARAAAEATSALPIIGDGDTGYGNAVAVKRTVRGFASAGLAGILIEDQVAPKSCGHVRGKRVVSRDAALARVRAACDARDEGADILIFARTDARQAVSMEEALWRVEAFAAAGADVVFIDALESAAELEAFGQAGGAMRSVPKMASVLEGGGRTPQLPRDALATLGFRVVAYPLSLLGVSLVAMRSALRELKAGDIPNAVPPFEDLQRILGFPEYYAEAARYAAESSSGGGDGSGGDGASVADGGTRAERPVAEADVDETAGATAGWDDAAAALAGAGAAGGLEGGSAAAHTGAGAGGERPGGGGHASDTGAGAHAGPERGGGGRGADSSSSAEGGRAPGGAVPGGMDPPQPFSEASSDGSVAPDGAAAGFGGEPRGAGSAEAAAQERGGGRRERPSAAEGAGAADGQAARAATADVIVVPKSRDGRGDGADFTRLSLLVRIINVASGRVSLETRIPADWLSAAANIIPQLGGADVGEVRELLEGLAGSRVSAGEPIFTSVTGSERIEVYLRDSSRP